MQEQQLAVLTGTGVSAAGRELFSWTVAVPGTHLVVGFSSVYKN